MITLPRLTSVLAIAGMLLLAISGTMFRTVAQEEPDPTVTVALVDDRFGAIESFWAPQEAAELNVGWERILFYWNEIQPTGPEDWNTLHVLEEWLVEAEAHDRTVLGLLKNTPAWATDGPPYSGIPRGLYLDIDDPQNLWANYVRRVVDYYAPRGVHNWVIWNEPEIEQGVYGHEFDGDVEEYLRLLQVAYLVAKERDPQAVIHLAGYSYWHDPAYLEEFFAELTADPAAAQNDYYFDALTLHIYFRVETVWDLVRQTDALQNSFGIDKPIWINETNAAPNIDPWWPVERPNFQVDLDQQAWFVIQAHALGFAAGADSIGVYKLIDILLPPGGESFGILRPDYSRRPAYLAYRTVIDLLQGFEGPVTREQTADYTAVTFPFPDKVVRVLWARQDQALIIAVPALTQEAKLVDFVGGAAEISAVEGNYLVELGGARCRDACEIGGPPVFLVEQITAPVELPTIMATPIRATLTATPEVTPSYTPWPTNTPTSTMTPTPTMTPTATATATPSPTTTPFPSPTAVPTVAGGVFSALDMAAPSDPSSGSPPSGSISLFSSWVPWSAAVLLLALLAYLLARKP